MRKSLLIAALLATMLFTAAMASVLKDDCVINFEVSPNPMDKHCVISLTFQNPLSITLQIQDLEGVLVKDIYSGDAGKNMSFTWDRLDESGEFVPSGKYVVVLGYDQRYTSTKKTLILK